MVARASGAGAFAAVGHDGLEPLRILRVDGAPLAQGREVLDHAVGQPLLAVDAAAGRGAALGGGLVGLVGQELPVPGVDGADLGVARVAAAQPRRVGEGGLDLLADLLGRGGDLDGVAHGLAHAPAVGAGEAGELRDQAVRFREDLRPEGKWWLKRRAISRVSSRCGSWSSPTGTAWAR